MKIFEFDSTENMKDGGVAKQVDGDGNTVKTEETEAEGEVPAEEGAAEGEVATEEGKDKSAKPSDDKSKDKSAKPSGDKAKTVASDKEKSTNKEKETKKK